MDDRKFQPRQCGISKTAGNMALIRALEFLKLPEKRLFSDPYARQFVPAYQRALLGAAHLPLVRVLLEGHFDWRVPGGEIRFAGKRIDGHQLIY